jgi:hypothetical protein
VKSSKWIFAGLLCVLFSGWALARQQRDRPAGSDTDNPPVVSQNSAQKPFLKVGDYYIDTSKIACVLRQDDPSRTIEIDFQGCHRTMIVAGKEETAALIRWLDTASFSPPSGR